MVMGWSLGSRCETCDQGVFVIRVAIGDPSKGASDMDNIALSAAMRCARRRCSSHGERVLVREGKWHEDAAIGLQLARHPPPHKQ